MPRLAVTVALLLLAGILCWPARATILWSDEGARIVRNTGMGEDNLGGKVKRDDNSNNVLYFKFHVDPISDVASEPYFAGFQLFAGDQAHLGVGNAEEAWGYSAFNTSEMGPSNKLDGEFNLSSAHPEPAHLGLFWPYEVVHHDVERTVIFKVQYVPGTDDLVTVWLEPNLGRGASDKNQPDNITTRFKADASFDQIRLRHNGGGNGWIFSDMAIATSFGDFVVVRFWQTWWFRGLVAMLLFAAAVATVRVVEQRKFRLQLQRAEQEHALERERARIAQDLHDDLGSSLTRISLLGSLLRADRNHPEQIEIHADKIAQAADQTVRALEEIVWAVRPGSDTLQSLVEYIAHFANELFEGNPTRCRLDLPSDIPTRPLPPDLRHNIFLIVKEALTNVLKHAGASEVNLQVKVAGAALEIVITDDGRGFDFNSAVSNRERNGLENMRRRAAVIGGTLVFGSGPDKGSRMEFRLDFTG